MAAVIGSLRAILGLDSAEFTNGLKKANSGLSSFVKGAKIGFAGVAAAATAAAGALGYTAKKAIDNADQMGELAQKIGVSVEALTRYGYAAKLSGSDTDTLANSLRKLSQNMLSVAQGSGGPVATAFNALGISVKNADGSLRDSDAVLLDIADKFAGLEDGATKTALAMQLFGRTGTELIPFLNQGSAGIGALANEADRLGVTISGQTANAAGAFNDILDRLLATFQGVVNKVVGDVLPSLNELGVKLADPQFAASARAIGSAIVEGMKLAVDAINTVGGALAVLKQGMDALGIQNKGAGYQDFNTPAEAIEILKGQLSSGNTDASQGNIYQGIFGANGAAGAAAEGTQVDDVLTELSTTMTDLTAGTSGASSAQSALNAIMAEGQSVYSATRTPAEAYSIEVERLNGLLQKGAIDQDTYNRAVTQAQDAFEQAENKGNQLASTLSSGLANVFSSVVDGSKSAVDAIGDLIKSLANMALQKGFELLVGSVFSGGGFGGLSLPSFAGGGFTGNAPRVGGVDGLGGFPALLHPGETVVDHTKGQSMGPTISITVYGSRQDATEIAQQVRKALPDAMQAYERNPLRRS